MYSTDIEDVISTLNFDLMDTVAGRQIYEEGVEKGVEEGMDSPQFQM